MLSLRLAFRDLRGSIGGFQLLVVCVALGTAAIAAVGLLSATVLDGVRSGARTSIGGDVSLRLFHQPPAPEHLAAFAAAGEASLTAELRPTAHHAGRSALVELKAVDTLYPLYGDLKLVPPLDVREALARRDGIWGATVAESLLDALGASLGDIVTVGGHGFELRALIADEPDRAMRAFTLGPRVMVALPAVAESELVAPGTQTYWYSRIRLAPERSAAAWIAGFERAFPDAGFRIVNADDGVPGVERTMALITSLLTFAAMGILLVASVGVGNAVSAWLDRKRKTIAILKVLGARSRLVMHLYLAQVLAAAFAGIAIGLAGGSLATVAAVPLLAEWLPAERGVPLEPLLIAGGFALLSTLLFALWPLGKAERQSPQALFRHLIAPAADRPGPRRLMTMALVAAMLAALFAWSAPLPLVAAIFALGAAGVVLLFLMLGRVVALAAGRAGRRHLFSHPLLRLALSNMHRPGAPTVPVVMAVGLCLTLLVAVAALRANADRHLATTLPATAPDLVVLNIPPADGGRFDAVLEAAPEVRRWERAPFLHARVSHIADQPVADRRVPAEMAFVIRGDRGLSWRAAPPREGIVAGTWWPEGYDGPPLISLDERVARHLGITVGDTLTLNLLGSPLRAEIVNLRTVDWSGLGLDFPILLSPPGELPPHREIAAVWTAPDAVAETHAKLAQDFPEAPAIVVSEIIGYFARVAAGAGIVLTAIAAAAGGAALLVVAGAVAAGYRRRVRDAVILKVLGATRRQVLAAAAIEFALVGLATAAVALVAGNLAASIPAGRLVEFQPVLAAAMPWIATALVTIAAIGLAAAWLALSRPASGVLRQD